MTHYDTFSHGHKFKKRKCRFFWISIQADASPVILPSLGCSEPMELDGWLQEALHRDDAALGVKASLRSSGPQLLFPFPCADADFGGYVVDQTKNRLLEQLFS